MGDREDVVPQNNTDLDWDSGAIRTDDHDHSVFLSDSGGGVAERVQDVCLGNSVTMCAGKYERGFIRAHKFTCERRVQQGGESSDESSFHRIILVDGGGSSEVPDSDLWRRRRSRYSSAVVNGESP